MSWKRELLISLVTLFASGSLGYFLGLKAKRPIVVIDLIKTNDKETYIRLNNIGESPARNVQIDDAILNLKLKPDGIFYKELNGTKIVFRFDKIAYIEPHKPKDVKAIALIEGKEESESVRQLYSYCLDDFKFLCVTYTDNLGLRCKCKLTDLKIEL